MDNPIPNNPLVGESASTTAARCSNALSVLIAATETDDPILTDEIHHLGLNSILRCVCSALDYEIGRPLDKAAGKEVSHA